MSISNFTANGTKVMRGPFAGTIKGSEMRNGVVFFLIRWDDGQIALLSGKGLSLADSPSV